MISQLPDNKNFFGLLDAKVKDPINYIKIYVLFLVLFVTFVLITNTIGSKVFTLDYTILLLGNEILLALPVSILCYPLTFLITDIVSEVYGSKLARVLVVLGFSMSVVLLIFAQLGISLEPAPFYNANESYIKIFGQSWRLLFASMAAYLLAQMVDVSLFHFWKRLTKGKHLWLRNNGSTMLSQLVYSITVNFIFLYNNPTVLKVKEGQNEFLLVMGIVIASYFFKIIIAAIDTPFCYMGVWIVEKLTGIDSKKVS